MKQPPFVPVYKHDDDAVALLLQTSWEEARPHAMELLKWLQDSNWPHAYPIRNYLIPHTADLVPEILEILATDDDIWKTNILYLLWQGHQVLDNPQLQAAVLRIAQHPTPGEVDYDTAETAMELAEKWNLL